jgi:hypothetical protein
MANLYIFDNFYHNVDDIRAKALKMEYNITGNFPGKRTPQIYNPLVKEKIAKLVKPFGGDITRWNLDGTVYNGCFQYTTSKDQSWIHADSIYNWAGVIYLTPNAPIDSGTGIFRNKKYNMMSAPLLEDGSRDEDLLNKIYSEANDLSKWDLVDKIGNVYNRLVLYRADLFHSSLNYFGDDINNGRLFQTFFFSTKY